MTNLCFIYLYLCPHAEKDCIENPPSVADATASGLQSADPPQYHYGHVITYSCNEGFERTAGDSQVACGVGPKWLGTLPVCSSMWKLNTFVSVILSLFLERRKHIIVV